MDPAGLVEPLQHAGDRWGFDGERDGDIGRGDEAARPAQPVNRFEIVLDGGRRLLGHAACPCGGGMI